MSGRSGGERQVGGEPQGESRALAHGRSAEAEHRAILEAALRSELSGRELWQKLLGPGYPEIDLDTGVDERIEVPDLA